MPSKQQMEPLETQKLSETEAPIRDQNELTPIKSSLNDDKSVLVDELNEKIDLITEYQAQIKALTRKNSELVATRDTLAINVATLTSTSVEQEKKVTELNSNLDKVKLESKNALQSASEFKKLFDQSQHQIKILQCNNDELHHRQQLLHDELVKAEAQIDLIQEILLREQGLYL